MKHIYQKVKFQFVEQLAYGREQAKRDDEGIVPYKPYFDLEDNPGSWLMPTQKESGEILALSLCLRRLYIFMVEYGSLLCYDTQGEENDINKGSN